MAKEYTVHFCQLFGAVGISDYSWSVKVGADSQADALEKALIEASAVNERSGMPPDGVHVSKDELRRAAVVRE